MTKRNIPLKAKEDQALEQFHIWRRKASLGPVQDEDVVRELEEMEGRRERIIDAFYRDLAFGTGGLRGIMGAGSNRMNVHTVARASQGLSEYIRALHLRGTNDPAVAVSYDSRMKSRLFAELACRVFAANGIMAYLYPEIMPTPCLSFAVRRLGCVGGVMVTASHNPREYNGYKVYDGDGCQVTVEAAGRIYGEMEKLDLFDHIRVMDFQEGLDQKKIRYISKEVCKDFIRAVQSTSVLGREHGDKTFSLVYTPLNGAGLKPVLAVLKESGYANVTVVEEQREPDGTFPTCPKPNPELKEALSLGIRYAEEREAELMAATDPDCDRVGIAVRDRQGKYVALTGNETGVLLLDYVCSRRRAEGTMPKRPVMVKTLVTTPMGERIAARYGVETVNVLTGFKFIGEQIGLLEADGREADFVFGFEESYGCLGGTYVRDKDGAGAVFLICEMCGYYRARGINLAEKLEELYEKYGFYADRLCDFSFPGGAGFEKMKLLMDRLRAGKLSLAGIEAKRSVDYRQGIGGLPKSDVLEFFFGEDCRVVVRPSGTEPKLKAYISVRAEIGKEAKGLAERMAGDLERLISSFQAEEWGGQNHDGRSE